MSGYPGIPGGAIHTMPIRAILFDKDGTLVDFQRTWGPATYTVLSRLCDGDHAAFERLAAVSLFDAEHRTLKPGSPVVIETTYGYGRLWAQALGRPLTARIRRRHRPDVLPDHARPSDSHGRREGACSTALRPRAAARHDVQRCRRQHPRTDASPRARPACCWNSSRPMIWALARKPAPDPVLAFAKFANVAPAEIAGWATAT